MACKKLNSNTLKVGLSFLIICFLSTISFGQKLNWMFSYGQGVNQFGLKSSSDLIQENYSFTQRIGFGVYQFIDKEKKWNYNLGLYHAQASSSIGMAVSFGDYSNQPNFSQYRSKVGFLSFPATIQRNIRIKSNYSIFINMGACLAVNLILQNNVVLSSSHSFANNTWQSNVKTSVEPFAIAFGQGAFGVQLTQFDEWIIEFGINARLPLQNTPIQKGEIIIDEMYLDGPMRRDFGTFNTSGGWLGITISLKYFEEYKPVDLPKFMR
jgi:hypothetical protein